MHNLKKIFLSKSSNTIAFFNILSAVLLNGINFFTLPFFSRLLGTEGYGKVSLYSTWVSIITIIMGLQAGSAIGSALQRWGTIQIKRYYSSTMSLITINFLFLLFILFLGMPIWVYITGFDQVVLLVMLFHCLGASFINFSSLRFTYNKEALLNFALSISVSLLSIALSLVLINYFSLSPNIYLGRIIGIAVVNIFAGICCYIAVFKQGRVFYDRKYWKFCLAYGIPLIFHGLSHIVLGQSDRIMLNYFSTESAVGIYSLVYTFSSVLNVIWTALNNTWVPFYYSYCKDKKTVLILIKSKRYLKMYTIIMLGFVLLAPEVYKIFASKEFWSGVNLIPILALSHYGAFIYSFPVNFEFYNRRTGFVAIGTFSTAIINIILNLLLIPRYSMWGAALATWISYIFLFLFHHIICKHLIVTDYHYKISFLLKYYIITIIMVSILSFYQISCYVRWMMAFLLGLLFIKEFYKEKTLF